MIEFIRNIDTQLFLYLNSYHNSFFDVVMHWITNRYFWIPVYLFLLILIWVKFKRKIWLIALTCIAMIVVSDQGSVWIKKNCKRHRPCHNISIQSKVHLVDGCGGEFGFVSSHASNTFALAMFMSLLFGGFKKRISKDQKINKEKNFFPIIIFIWASLVSYSRIYVGVHYPIDLIGGALLGVILGFLFSNIYVRLRSIIFHE